jgi:hypothetical protein
VAAEGFNPFHSGMVPRYQEIATFMRAARASLEPPLDVALVGVPLDIGATYRVGARHGPAGVREASRLIRQVNPTTGVKPFELCNVGDVGDAPTDPLDVVRSVALIEEFFERIHSVGAAPLAVGGDHTVPLGSDPDVGQRSAMPMRWRVSGSFGGRSVHPDGGVATKARPRRRLIEGILNHTLGKCSEGPCDPGNRCRAWPSGAGHGLARSAARMEQVRVPSARGWKAGGRTACCRCLGFVRDPGCEGGPGWRAGGRRVRSARLPACVGRFRAMSQPRPDRGG